MVLIKAQVAVASLLTLAVTIGAVAATIHAITVRGDAFPTVGKQSKVFWVALLAVSAVLVPVFGVLYLPGLIGTVIVLVYLADVRPRVDDILGRSWFRKAA